MSRLFIEHYLDEDVSVLVAELLRARGFAAETTREAGRRNAYDHHGIIIAVRRPPQEIARRLLVILNRTTADEMRGQLIYI